jgi:molybdate transport system permease protein
MSTGVLSPGEARRIGGRSGRPPVVMLALAACGVLFVALPLIGLLVRAPWGSARSVLTSPVAVDALKLSLIVSLSATALALLLGFPLAWVLARVEFTGRSVVRALVTLPLVLPPVVAGVALLTALGRRGLVGTQLAKAGILLPFSTGGAIVAAAFVAFPLLVLSVEAGVRSVDPRLEQAASTMGASRWYVLHRVTLPLIRSPLIAGLVLAWARALGEFGATITFAGNLRGRTQTLPLAVFEAGQSDPGAAIVLSVLLVALSFGVLIVLRGRFLDAR